MMREKSFTLIEVLAMVGILIVLIAISIPALRFFQKETDLNNTTEEIINNLRLAQNKTLASERASQWGVYFSTSSEPHQYTLFKGVNFALRDSSFDEIHKLPKSLEIYEINLGGGGEVVFERVTGSTNQSGNVSLRLKTDLSKTKSLFIQSSGKVVLGGEAAPTDTNRIKDSRHTHFDYSRPITTTTEILKLTFAYDSSTATKDIIIADNLKDGQIYWDGQVDVGGQIQKLKIHTHRLNSPGSQFSIHRDKRYNTKALTVEISGDSSGNLIQYDAAGQTTKGTSIYASTPSWQ